LAAARIPATQRGVSRALILATGHAVGSEDDLDWAALARTGQPLVVYMGLAALGSIAAALMRGGLDAGTPAAVIAGATTAAERVLVADLGSIAGRAAAEGIRPPAVIVVGAIVALRDELLSLARAGVPA
jgi:uroporphyrin-III C-methyltransferase